MTQRTHRKPADRQIHAAWFIVPMSVAAAALMAMGTLAIEPEPPAPRPPVQAQQPAAEPAPQPEILSTPEVHHVQAF